MATNKNAQLRFHILDRCFSSLNRKFEINDLLEEVNDKLSEASVAPISLRTLRSDIEEMRSSYNAPIETYPIEGKRCYYRYSDRRFSIYKNELSASDIDKLQSTIDMLDRFRGSASFAWLEDIISNLECRFGLKSNAEHLVSFEQNEQLKGLEHLTYVIDATINHESLDVLYQTFNGKEMNMTLHPYFVKQYNGRWFLYGLNEERNDISNIALDRIVSKGKSNVPFKKNEQYDFATFFDEVVGVTIPKEDVKVETIGLRFSVNRFPYVLSKPIHKSQSVVNKDDCVVEIKVRPTRELDQQLFSFIPDVEVLYPEWYRQYVKEKIEENLKKYLSMQIDCIDSSELCTR